MRANSLSNLLQRYNHPRALCKFFSKKIINTLSHASPYCHYSYYHLYASRVFVKPQQTCLHVCVRLNENSVIPLVFLYLFPGGKKILGLKNIKKNCAFLDILFVFCIFAVW